MALHENLWERGGGTNVDESLRPQPPDFYLGEPLQGWAGFMYLCPLLSTEPNLEKCLPLLNTCRVYYLI